VNYLANFNQTCWGNGIGDWNLFK